jgi:hypothetical protein
LLKNNIDIEQVNALGAILAEHPTLQSLCGLDSTATEADFSNRNLTAPDAALIGHDLRKNKYDYHNLHYHHHHHHYYYYYYYYYCYCKSLVLVLMLVLVLVLGLVLVVVVIYFYY